jgi:hypothetical protein
VGDIPRRYTDANGVVHINLGRSEAAPGRYPRLPLSDNGATHRFRTNLEYGYWNACL